MGTHMACWRFGADENQIVIETTTTTTDQNE